MEQESEDKDILETLEIMRSMALKVQLPINILNDAVLFARIYHNEKLHYHSLNHQSRYSC